MTDPLVIDVPGIRLIDAPRMSPHLIAGRRAAMRLLQDLALAHGWNLHEKAAGDDYDGQGCLKISGDNVNVDIGPAIDAAVCETVLRMQPEPKRRPWWRFW